MRTSIPVFGMSMRGFAVLLALLGLVPAGPAGAESLEVPFTLGRAIEVALQHNEDILASYHQVDASKAAVTSAKGAYDTTLFSTNKYASFNALSSNDYDYLNNAAISNRTSDTGLRQRVPTGGVVSTYYSNVATQNLGLVGGQHRQYKDYLTVEFVQSLLKGIADKEQRGAIEKAGLSVSDSEEARQLAVIQVVANVTREYWLLKLSRQNLEAARDVLGMAQELLRREQVRCTQGLSQGVDVDRAESSVKERELAVLQYERDIQVGEERLLLLLNVPDTTPGTRVLPVTPPDEQVAPLPALDASLSAARANRNELKQMAILLKQLGIEFDIAGNKLLPTLDLTLGYRTSNGNDQLRTAEDFRDTNSKGSWNVGVLFNYPLQNREARGADERVRQLIQVAQQRTSKTARSVDTEVQEAMTNLRLAQDAIPVARQGYEFSLQTMEGELRRFEMFQTNNRDLLTSQDKLARDQMAYYRAVVDYNLAKLSYAVACGTLLAERNIEVGAQGASVRK